MSEPKLCSACGQWHRGSICGLMACEPAVTHAPVVTHAPSLTVGESVTHGPKTHAQRQALWRKQHPERHAAQQRKFRAR